MGLQKWSVSGDDASQSKRPHPEQTSTGEKIMSPLLPRFGKSTRWFHWSVVIPFLLLAISGAALMGRELLLLDPDQVRWIVQFHKWCAIALLTFPPVIFLSGETFEVLSNLKEPFLWSGDDIRWLALQPIAGFRKKPLPPAGKLNAGQKVNALLSIFLLIAFTSTGIWLWARPGALAPWFIHIALFFIWIPIFIGHFFLATMNPSTRHAFKGMTSGTVRRDWAEYHHPRWVHDIDTNSNEKHNG